MKKIIFTFVLLVICACPALAKQKGNALRVLFVGNSLTSANNLPMMVSDIAKQKGYDMVFDSYTKGGAKLQNHAADDNLRKKLESGSWDFVVFQEQSQLPSFSGLQIAKDVLPFAGSLNSEVKSIDKNSKVIFYMTMARKNGDPANRNVSPDLLTYKGTQKRINKTYLKIARDNSAMLAPVGVVWRKMRKKYPDINLYADNVHPSRLGTYLAACVFYCVLFECSVKDLTPPVGVDHKSALIVQKVVDQVMCKGNGQWDFTAV